MSGDLPGTIRLHRCLMRLVKTASICVLLCAVGVPLSAFGGQKTASDKSIKTTITALVKKRAIFNGKRVRVLASFQTDGFERSILLEPNCGLLGGTSKTPPPNEPQCHRGVVPFESDLLKGDLNNERLDQVLKQGERSTRDKHITAEFYGTFRCDPTCTSPRSLILEIERLDNLEVVMKDLKAHRPK
jgi:hypothetical protein